MELIKREFVKFDVVYLKKLLISEKINEAYDYIKLFFFKYKDKTFFFDGLTFYLYEKDKSLKLIPDDLKITIVKPNEHTKKFESQNISLKDFLKSSEFMQYDYIPTVDFDKDLIFTKNKSIRGHVFEERFLNMKKHLNIDTTIKVIINDKIRTKLDLIYTHIKEVLSSDNEELYEYILNFLACSFAGHKIKHCLYFQSTERTGKGIILNDLLKGILGDRLFKTNSIESLVKYTKDFEGCSLLNFDELPHCENYKSIQDLLKGLITEPEFCSRDMFTKGYNQINSFNIIISTNNDAVQLSQHNQARYIIADVSEHRIGDDDYFKLLGNAINNTDVKKAFYQEMIERFKTLNNWNENKIPNTESRKMKIIEGLPMLYKYIKETYILNALDMDIRTDVFLVEYKYNSKDRSSNQKIGRMLKKIGVVAIKNSNNEGYNYKVSFSQLHEIYKSNEWMDDIIDKINNANLKYNKNTSIDHDGENYKKLYEDLLLKNKCNKKQIQNNNNIDDLENEFNNILK